MTIPDKLAKATYNELKAFLNWGEEALDLGDIVEVDGSVLKRLGSIRDEPYGIQFDPAPWVPGGNISVQHGKGTRVTFSVGGKVTLPRPVVPVGLDGQIEVAVAFESEEAFLFKCNDWTARSIANQIRLREQLKALYQDGTLDRKYAVVDSVVRSPSFILIASSDKKTEVNFAINADLEPGQMIDIGDVHLNLVPTNTSNSSIYLKGNGDVGSPSVPLATLTCVKGGWWFSKIEVGAKKRGLGGELENVPADDEIEVARFGA